MAVVIRKAIQQHHAQSGAQGKEILPVVLLLESFANKAAIVLGWRFRRRYIRQSPRSPEVVHLFSSHSPQREQGPTLEIPGIAGGPAAVDHKNVPIHIGILRV